MSDKALRFWGLQLFILAVWGISWLLAPSWCLSILVGVPVEELSASGIDQLRMSAPYLLGFGGFTLFAILTRRTTMIRGFGVIFAIILGLWSVANWVGIYQGLYAIPAIALAVIPSVLTLGNILIAIPQPMDWRRAEDAGQSATKPPGAFVAWLIQGTVLFGGGAMCLAFPAFFLATISGQDQLYLTDVAVHQTRLLGALTLGMVAFSFWALRAQRSYAWRGFAFFFSAFLSVWAISIGWILAWGNYDLPVLVVLLPGLIFLPMNIILARMRGEWDPGDVNARSEQWTPLDLIVGPLMMLSVLRTRRRSSHLMGVAANGEFLPAPRKSSKGVPSNDFFDGTSYPVRMRFANLTALDDAALDVRGAAIKFSQHRYESPFDLMLNTGSHSPVSNVVEFASFVLGKFATPAMAERALMRNRVGREGGIAGLRRAPDTYAGLYYHSQIVRYWSDLEGHRYLVRYRCIPDPGNSNERPEETGLPTTQDASHIWLRGRLASDHRPTDYLRQEFKRRLEGDGTIRMRLEAQFHRPAPGDSAEWFNASVDWDEATHPWQTLGTLELTEALEDAEAEFLQFDPANHPVSHSIPRASGPFDYRSLGDSEERVVRALQRLRLRMYGASGLPTFGEVAER
jgi:hypothetical protein